MAGSTILNTKVVSYLNTNRKVAASDKLLLFMIFVSGLALGGSTLLIIGSLYPHIFENIRQVILQN